MTEVEIGPQPGPQDLFLACSADICIYGGAAGGGKTYALILEPLHHILNTDGFGTVIFRRTTPQIRNEGGLWDTSESVYPYFQAEPKESTLEWLFPNGNRIKFAHLEYEKNVLDWQGSQITLICFDELTHFTSKQFFYMMSRNRSTCGVKPYIRATCNPDADSWVAKFIEWWIDQDTGFPIPEHAGVIRWFIRLHGELIWGDTKEGLIELYPKSIPKSITFIPAKLSDNKILEDKDPGYRANLQALSLVDNERLEKGNWKIKPEAGTMFRREWFEIIDETPPNLFSKVRFWDMAGTEKTKANADPDWTAGVKMARDKDFFYILDIVRVQMNPTDTDAVIEKTLEIDGYEVVQKMEQEPGSSGKKVIEDYKKGIFKNYNFEGLPSTGSKVARANRFSAAAGAKRIKLLRGPWIEAFIQEAEHFPDGPHDDMCFIAGTQIYTDRGLVPIEEIKKHDKVLTRDGFKDVTASGSTSDHSKVKTLVFENGKSITATLNHPIYVIGKGFISMDAIRYGDFLLSVCKTSMKSNSMESSLEDIPNQKQSLTKDITPQTVLTGIEESERCIKKFGNFITEKSPTGLLSITKTIIHSITQSKTSNVSQFQNIASNITMKIGKTPMLQICSLNTLMKLDPLLNNGMRPKKGESGILNMQKKRGNQKKNLKNTVNNVEKNLNTTTLLHISGSVQTDADPRGGEMPVLTTKQGYVNGVERSLQQTDIQIKAVALKVVGIKERGGLKKVYNLTVSDAHEYFANGVLVHNCDAAAGAYNYLSGISMGKAAKSPVPEKRHSYNGWENESVPQM